MRKCFIRRYVPILCFCLGFLAIWGSTTADAQDYSTLAGTERDLNRFKKVELHSFADRDAFLAIIDRTLGLKNIKGSDRLFAKLPRSPFTITGRRGNNQEIPCQIFIPAKITPGNGTEIFAELMRGWFGNRLSYASSAELTFGWLMRHEVRHCDPTHFGDKGDKERDDEIDADLFALNAVTDPQSHDQLARDALAFRMITASLFASKSHMTGLSLKRALAGASPAAYPPAKDEIAAFLAVRKMVFDRAKAISVAASPSNQDVIRAVIDLSQTSQDNPLTTEILGDLDRAIAHFAPKLHNHNQSVR